MSELITEIQQKLKDNGIVLSLQKTKDVLNIVLDTIISLTRKNGRVLTNVGVFKSLLRKERKSVIPKLGKKVTVPAYKTIVFKLSKKLKITF